jgi:hypothetical protein
MLVSVVAPRTFVALQVVELKLGQVSLAVNAVERLQLLALLVHLPAPGLQVAHESARLPNVTPPPPQCTSTSVNPKPKPIRVNPGMRSRPILVEADPQEAVERERGIPQPRVPIVPVPDASQLCR